MDPEALPPIPKDLLEALDKRYPEVCAEPGQPIDELMFYGGKRDLIRWLHIQYRLQQSDPDQEDE